MSQKMVVGNKARGVTVGEKSTAEDICGLYSCGECIFLACEAVEVKGVDVTRPNQEI